MISPEHFGTGDYTITPPADKSFDSYAAILDYQLEKDNKPTRDKEYLKLREKDWK